MQLQYDIEFTIATAPQRFAKKWKHTKTTWSHLLERLSKPTVTGETVAEYKAMKKSDRDNRKDIGGFVCGYLKGGHRLKQNVEYRQVVCLDADSPDDDFLTDLDIGMGNVAWGLYTTHSHTAAAPRYRVLIPLDRPVTADEYKAIARLLAKDVNIEAMDSTTYEPERLMYWPSKPQDGEFIFRYNDAPILNADDVLNRYEDWHDTSLWPTSKKEASVTLSTAKKQGDPLTKPGLIGAFCRAHTIEDAIETFLADEYTACAVEGRYTYAKGSTSAGLVVYDDKFAYSHHSTDPAGGKLCNAFDLVRLHKFGALDADAAEGTPPNKLPSYVAMVKLAGEDEATRRIISTEQAEDIKKSFKESGFNAADANMDWMAELTRGSGKNAPILPVAGNFIAILENDPQLTKCVGFDLFSHRAMIRKRLPWRKEDNTGEPWQDKDDAGLRNYLSEIYDLSARQVVDDALTQVIHDNAYHPVREYLKELKWDGVKRAETLFIDFLGAKNSQYVKDVTLTWLKAAVARVMHPGIKYDCCVVLSGPQGIGKGTLLNALGRRWYNSSITDIQTKDAMEQLRGSWIVELDEMKAVTKAENDSIKAFLSRRIDRFRPAYGRRMEDFPRQCVFAATTNDRVFLKDRTGGRRFLPVFCTGRSRRILKKLTNEFIDQIWAEVFQTYQKDNDLEISEASTEVARTLQELSTEGSEKKGLVLEYLNTLLPRDWQAMDIYDRREYLDNYDSDNPPENAVKRDRVCALEIWCEVFKGNRVNFRNSEAREINAIMQQIDGWKFVSTVRFGNLYGRQRAYIRVNKDEKNIEKAPNGVNEIFQ